MALEQGEKKSVTGGQTKQGLRVKFGNGSRTQALRFRRGDRAAGNLGKGGG